MILLKKAWDWVVKSSADPAKLSLTLKAGVPFVIILLGWTKVAPFVDANLAGEQADNLVSLLVILAQVGTGLISAFGLCRKIYNSFKVVSA